MTFWPSPLHLLLLHLSLLLFLPVAFFLCLSSGFFCWLAMKDGQRRSSVPQGHRQSKPEGNWRIRGCGGVKALPHSVAIMLYVYEELIGYQCLLLLLYRSSWLNFGCLQLDAQPKANDPNESRDVGLQKSAATEAADDADVLIGWWEDDWLKRSHFLPRSKFSC